MQTPLNYANPSNLKGNLGRKKAYLSLILREIETFSLNFK